MSAFNEVNDWAHNQMTDDDIEESGFKQTSHFPEVIQRKMRNSGQRVQRLSHISEEIHPESTEVVQGDQYELAKTISVNPNIDKKLSELDKKTNNMEEKLSEIIVLLKKFSDK